LDYFQVKAAFFLSFQLDELAEVGEFGFLRIGQVVVLYLEKGN
jgi:hypothetical protein